MTYDIDEPSAPLQTLHEAVVRYLERQGVVLKSRNVWSYSYQQSCTPFMDEIVSQFLDLTAAESQARLAVAA